MYGDCLVHYAWYVYGINPTDANELNNAQFPRVDAASSTTPIAHIRTVQIVPPCVTSSGTVYTAASDWQEDWWIGTSALTGNTLVVKAMGNQFTSGTLAPGGTITPTNVFRGEAAPLDYYWEYQCDTSNENAACTNPY